MGVSLFAMGERVFVVGVGMTPFMKASTGPDWPEMCKAAIQQALDDASLSYEKVETAVVGYNYGEPTCGQAAVYQVGLTGIPVCNVNNNCSTGSTALFLARNMVKSSYDCALALGFEKMRKSLSQVYTDSGYTSPVAKHFDHLFALGAHPGSLGKQNAMTENVIKMFGEAAIEHQQLFGTTDDHYAMVAYKNHRQSKFNPYAQMQKEFPLEVIKDQQRKLYGPLTIFQACPVGDGAACAILCNEKFLERNPHLKRTAIEIVGQTIVSDLPSSFDAQKKSFRNLCGFDLCKRGAEQVYTQSGLSPNDVDVLEVHDCFSSNELMMYEAMGLCKEGQGSTLLDNGKWISNSQGGELYRLQSSKDSTKGWVVNPSGGLESKGHPLGATGIAQCAELCWQLRGEAGPRQVPNASVGLQHNFGLGSAAVITLYQRPVFPSARL